MAEEYLDVLDEKGQKTGIRRRRISCHREGLPHLAVHTWIVRESDGFLLVQKRARCKEAFPGCWDISSAGHVAAGETSHGTAVRELQEELGVTGKALFPLFSFSGKFTTNGGKFKEWEFVDVYVILVDDSFDITKLKLQESEVEAVQWISQNDLNAATLRHDPAFVSVGDHSVFLQKLNDFLSSRKSLKH